MTSLCFVAFDKLFLQGNCVLISIVDFTVNYCYLIVIMIVNGGIKVYTPYVGLK